MGEAIVQLVQLGFSLVFGAVAVWYIGPFSSVGNHRCVCNCGGRIFWYHPDRTLVAQSRAATRKVGR